MTISLNHKQVKHIVNDVDMFDGIDVDSIEN
jgi:hypothetical protein